MEPAQARFLLGLMSEAIGQEFESTRKVIQAVPEDRKGFRPDPKARSAFELAWHIVASEEWFAQGILNGEFAIEGEGQEKVPAEVRTVADLVRKFHEVSGETLAVDRMLLE